MTPQPQRRAAAPSFEKAMPFAEMLCREMKPLPGRPSRLLRGSGPAPLPMTSDLQGVATAMETLVRTDDSRILYKPRFAHQKQKGAISSLLKSTTVVASREAPRHQRVRPQPSSRMKLDTILEDQVFPSPSTRKGLSWVVSGLCLYSDPIIASILLNVGVLLTEQADAAGVQLACSAYSWVAVPLTVVVCLCLSTREQAMVADAVPPGQRPERCSLGFAAGRADGRTAKATSSAWSPVPAAAPVLAHPRGPRVSLASAGRLDRRLLKLQRKESPYMNP